jgi:hypothetical protein
MFADTADALVWIIRLVLLAGLCWGAWLCIGHLFLPARREKALQFEHFATFALLVLLFSTLGGVLHAG